MLDSVDLAKEIPVESHSMSGIWRFWNLEQVGPANLGEKKKQVFDVAEHEGPGSDIMRKVETRRPLGKGVRSLREAKTVSWPKELVLELKRRRSSNSSLRVGGGSLNYILCDTKIPHLLKRLYLDAKVIGCWTRSSSRIKKS